MTIYNKEELETEEKDKFVHSSSGKITRKLKHNPDVYYCWFISNQVLNEFGKLPSKISKDWKLKDYPLPKDWKHRNDVLSVCKKFLEEQGYRLFGDKIGDRCKVIVDEKNMKWKPQEQVLISVPLDKSKTINQRLNEIKKLLQTSHKFTGKYKDEYPNLEGCDWDFRKDKRTSKYQTTMKKPRSLYWYEITMFIRYCLERNINPLDLKERGEGIKKVKLYLDENITEHWTIFTGKGIEDMVVPKGLPMDKVIELKRENEPRYIVRFRNDTITLYNALLEGKFPK